MREETLQMLFTALFPFRTVPIIYVLSVHERMNMHE